MPLLLLLLLNHLFFFCYGAAVIEIMVLFVCDIQVCIQTAWHIFPILLYDAFPDVCCTCIYFHTICK